MKISPQSSELVQLLIHLPLENSQDYIIMTTYI